jgi:hypothetical protein
VSFSLNDDEKKNPNINKETAEKRREKTANSYSYSYFFATISISSENLLKQFRNLYCFRFWFSLQLKQPKATKITSFSRSKSEHQTTQFSHSRNVSVAEILG